MHGTPQGQDPASWDISRVQCERVRDLVSSGDVQAALEATNSLEPSALRVRALALAPNDPCPLRIRNSVARMLLLVPRVMQ